MRTYKSWQEEFGQKNDYEKYVFYTKDFKRSILELIFGFFIYGGGAALILLIGYGWQKWFFFSALTAALIFGAFVYAWSITCELREIRRLETENPDISQTLKK